VRARCRPCAKAGLGLVSIRERLGMIAGEIAHRLTAVRAARGSRSASRRLLRTRPEGALQAAAASGMIAGNLALTEKTP